MGKYAIGARLENTTKDILLEDDWVAVRAAGSHGIIDVIAIKRGIVWFIQCRKGGNLALEERKELVALAKKHGAISILVYKTKEGIVFKEIKSKEPTFHYQIVNGKFIKVDKEDG